MKYFPRTQCATRGCKELATSGVLYCESHLAEAMARVQNVLKDRPRPWSGVTRGSQVGRSPARMVRRP